MRLFDLYTHQESAITNRTNLALVAQSFLVVGFVGAISNGMLQLALASLGLVVTILTLYVGGRELQFFLMVRKKLEKEEPIFGVIDKELSATRYLHLNFLGRASYVLCYYLPLLFGIFWLFCVCYAVWGILHPKI